jgi:hypothetical protein
MSTDGWDDSAHRHLYNYMVITNDGPFFLDSVDVTGAAVAGQDDTLRAKFIADNLLEKIEQLGASNVTSVVTDGPTVMRAAWKIIEEKYPHIVCSWCSGHVMNLLLGDLGKLSFVKTLVDEAKEVVKFIRGHFYTKTELLKLVKKVLILPSETRFATSFYMLERLFELKDYVIEITSTKAYKDWLRGKKYVSEGGAVAARLADQKWWERIESLLDLSGPIVNVLRVADSDIPQAGKIYNEMYQLEQRLLYLLEEEEGKGVLSKQDIAEVNCMFTSSLVE